MTSDEPSTWRARIPADIDRPDPVLAGLSVRQLLLLAPVALCAWALIAATRGLIPLWATGAALVPLAGAAIALVLGRRDGIGLDRLAALALTWRRGPKHRVGAPDGVAPLPDWAPADPGGPHLEPLRLPASAITASGVVDLDGRCAVMIASSTANLHLASGREQDAAIAAFAALLHALTAPAQILVRGTRLDLAPFADSLRAGAPHLPHPALEEAAHAHADFLTHLQESRELLHRTVIVVLTAPGRAEAVGPGLVRRAEDVAAQLGGLGVAAQVCDGDAATHVLRSCLHPASTRPDDAAGPAGPEEEVS
ncbi:PrgI family protein [Murinocardiopsis flavida]|uniref:PrgI family protein n=1 Tax=Murinocardiopsis flavida TaxID=645275 RepID=A0A2P8DG86_9ACTN|nr:PrgI family protein [Murinocardiopsis flavida]PSK96237.1 PrgI family protein [Murinocardiopsis flavida]